MNRLTLLLAFVLLTSIHAGAQRYGNHDDITKFRIAVQGGLSYRLATLSTNIPATLQDYYAGQKKGYHFGGNATFFFGRILGVGIQFSSFRAGTQLTNITVTDTLNHITAKGNISDYTVINFIGPSLNTRFMFGANDNMHLLASVALGYVSYKDDAVFITPYMVKSSTGGISLNLGFDIAVHKNIYLGIEGGLIQSATTSLDYSDATTSQTIKLAKGHAESFSRFDVSGGIRFNF